MIQQMYIYHTNKKESLGGYLGDGALFRRYDMDGASRLFDGIHHVLMRTGFKRVGPAW